MSSQHSIHTATPVLEFMILLIVSTLIHMNQRSGGNSSMKEVALYLGSKSSGLTTLDGKRVAPSIATYSAN